MAIGRDLSDAAVWAKPRRKPDPRAIALRHDLIFAADSGIVKGVKAATGSDHKSVPTANAVESLIRSGTDNRVRAIGYNKAYLRNGCKIVLINQYLE